WAACPAQPAEFWVERLRHCVNLVAGTTASITIDAEFGDAHKATFDLLILDEAQQLTESEFIVAARRARRWVLLGEPASQNETRKERQHKRGARTNGNDAPSRPGSHTFARSFFQRLWQYLHCDLWDREN